MLLDALMQEDEESEIDYAKLKGKAHDRETSEKEPVFGQKTPDQTGLHCLACSLL